MSTSTDNYMAGFVNKYPTIESRHTAAVQLADPVQGLPDDDHRSWDFMLAHWGDSEESLRSIGEFVWDLSHDMPRVGEQIAVVTRGTTDEILSANPVLDDDIKLTFGHLLGRELIYGFEGNSTQKGPSRLGVRPPFLGFGLRIYMNGVVEISADMLGGPYAEKPTDGRPIRVAAYFGVVPISEKIENYQTERKTVQKDLLLGKKACQQAIEALRSKTTSGLHPALIRSDKNTGKSLRRRAKLTIPKVGRQAS